LLATKLIEYNNPCFNTLQKRKLDAKQEVKKQLSKQACTSPLNVTQAKKLAKKLAYDDGDVSHLHPLIQILKNNERRLTLESRVSFPTKVLNAFLVPH